jgi:hypothetical protein
MAGTTMAGTTAAGTTMAGTTAAGTTMAGTTAAGTTMAGTTAAWTTTAGPTTTACEQTGDCGCDYQLVQCINKPPQGKNCVFDRRDGACYSRDTFESIKSDAGFDQKTEEEQEAFEQYYLMSQDPDDVTNRTLPTLYSGPLTTQSTPVTTQSGGVNSTSRATPTNNSITSSDVSNNTTPVAANQTEQTNVASVDNTPTTRTGSNGNNRNNRRGNNSDNYSANTVRFDNASMSNFGVENGPSASNLDMVNNNYYYENNSSNSLVNNREETGSDEPEEIKYYVHTEGEEGADNTLYEYEYKNVGDLRDQKSLEDVEQDVYNSMKNKLVLTNDLGSKYLYDPHTHALTTFEKTRNDKNRIKKLENKVRFLEDTVHDKTTVNFADPNNVREKLIFPVVEDNEVVYVSQDFGNSEHPVVTTRVNKNANNTDNEIEVNKNQAANIVNDLARNVEEEELLEELNINKTEVVKNVNELVATEAAAEEVAEEVAEAAEAAEEVAEAAEAAEEVAEELAEAAEAAEELAEAAEAAEELAEAAEAAEELAEVAEAAEEVAEAAEAAEATEQEESGMSMTNKILMGILIIAVLVVLGVGIHYLLLKPANPVSSFNTPIVTSKPVMPMPMAMKMNSPN